jgi:hypothetical protein
MEQTMDTKDGGIEEQGHDGSNHQGDRVEGLCTAGPSSTEASYVVTEQLEEPEFIFEDLRAEKELYWAELRVKYKYSEEGANFACYVTHYRARNNGRKDGNVLFYTSFNSGEGDVIELTNNAWQNGEWHELPYGHGVAAFGRDVTIGFDYIYNVNDAKDPILKTYVVKRFKPATPTLDNVHNFASSTFNVSGGNGIARYTLILDHGDGTSTLLPLNSHGRWSVPVTVDDEQNSIKIQAYQQITGFESDKTPFTTLFRARLTEPVAGSALLPDEVVFKGMGAPGSMVRVVSASNHNEEWSASVNIGESGTWEAPMTRLPTNGAMSVKAQLKMSGAADFDTEIVSFNVRLSPVITSPPPLTLQNQSFLLEGGNGQSGARIVVYVDLTNSLVGSGTVSQGSKVWNVSVTDLLPGSVSLVAEQIVGGVPSGRGEPRSFRIRPPKLEAPEVTFLPDTTVEFSGTGHYDKNLRTEIQFSASDGSLPLPLNTYVDAQGHWRTIPIVWPLGSYKVTVLQKIADNANGWIESHPLEFEVHNDMPDITEASYTEEYLPVFSGIGYTGATVSLRFPDRTDAARSVVVVNGQWSTPALVKWGPTDNQEVRITQHLGNYPSQRPFSLFVTIQPLAPGLDDPSEEDRLPIFSGTCWPEALVKLRFSDDDREYEAHLEGERWTFQRPEAFEPGVLHRVTVTQIVAGLTSVPTSKTFTAHRVMLQPLIVAPVSGSEVGYDVTIEGRNGMQGAVMQLHDSQMGGELGDQLELLEEGNWSIQLSNLELREYFLHAQQTLNGRNSANSAEHMLKVVVPPPCFTMPIPGGKAPRASKITGTGKPRAWVEVWLAGAAEPLLTAIEVNASGEWEAEVSLPVGNTTIWAFQTFVHNGITQRSQPNERLRYKVVPAAPLIETPTADDHVGRRVVVSGFATPGDTVTVTLGSDQASAEVRENRTWSVTLEPGQDEGNHELEAVAAYEGFESDSAKRTLQVATYLPTIENPAPGDWVSKPVLFAGKGRPGVGVLVDPFNPDKIWAKSIQVISDWRVLSDQPLPAGGIWCRFKLKPSDSDPVGSDWVVSERFEIESAPTDEKRK